MDTFDCLTSLLEEVLVHIKPSEEDYNKRLSILSSLRKLAKDAHCLKDATFFPFGSFVSELYTKWGDLDVSIESHHHQHKKGKNKILEELSQVIRKSIAENVTLIPSARVPLLIFEDPFSKISCDITVNSQFALLKSKCLYLICEMDPRVRDLIFLIKYWAKANKVNDPKNRTLNSYSLTLLVLFHLQRQFPPIIPTFKEICWQDIAKEIRRKRATSEIILQQFSKRIGEMRHDGFGKKNQSSISELFVSFFNQYVNSAEFCSKEFALCTFTGKWVQKHDKQVKFTKKKKKRYSMMILDPIDQKDNCARSVTEESLRLIYLAFRKTSELLQRQTASMDMHSLRQLLFDSFQEQDSLNMHQASSRNLKTPYIGQNQPYYLENTWDRVQPEPSLQPSYMGSILSGDMLPRQPVFLDQHNRQSFYTAQNHTEPYYVEDAWGGVQPEPAFQPGHMRPNLSRDMWQTPPTFLNNQQYNSQLPYAVQDHTKSYYFENTWDGVQQEPASQLVYMRPYFSRGMLHTQPVFLLDQQQYNFQSPYIAQDQTLLPTSDPYYTDYWSPAEYVETDIQYHGKFYPLQSQQDSVYYSLPSQLNQLLLIKKKEMLLGSHVSEFYMCK